MFALLVGHDKGLYVTWGYKICTYERKNHIHFEASTIAAVLSAAYGNGIALA